MSDQDPIQPQQSYPLITGGGFNIPTATPLSTSSQSVILPTAPLAQPAIGSSRNSKFNIKKILMIVGGITVALLVGFFMWRAFFYTPTPQKFTLTYWDFKDETPALQELISEYESQNPLVNIKYVKQSREDYRERVSNTIAKNEAPDIFPIHNTWLPMFSGDLSQLPPEVMDKNTYSSSFYPTAVNDLTQEGNIYAIPFMFDGLGLFFNQSIFEETGKTPPTTWDELRQTAYELTIVDEDKKIQRAGIAMGRVDNMDYWQDVLSLLILQVGIDPGRPTGKLTEDAIQYFTTFSTEDNIWNESLPPSTQTFASGKVAMYLGPASEITNIKKLNPNLSFKVVKVPQLPRDVPNTPSVYWSSYWAGTVWAKSKNPTEAWKFINFLTQKTSLERLNKEEVSKGGVGGLYPRPEMSAGFEADPYLGAFYAQAPTAKSWYLVSSTNDGATGINSRISALYAQAINSLVVDGDQIDDVLVILSSGISQVLSSYKK